MKRTSRKIAAIGIVVLALALVGFAAACGDGDDTASPTDTPVAPSGASETPSSLQEAIDQIDAMLVAANAGDIVAAEAAFEAGHGVLHEVIESLEANDADQAAALDDAAEDAEQDFEDAADAEHIVEIAQEIRDLLGQVQ